MTRAAIDVGSNSILLLVAKFESGQWTPILEEARVTGIGKGTASTGLLNSDGAAESLRVLRDFFQVARSHGVAQVRAAGTMALRIAADTQLWLDRACAQGTPVEVLSGEKEAELGFRAVVDDPAMQIGADDVVAMIDPGGHSTELVLGTRTSIQFLNSFSIGALGLRDGALRQSPASPAERFAATIEVDKHFAKLEPPASPFRTFTVGSTGVNLISIRERLADFDLQSIHGQSLEFEEIARAFGWLAGMTDEERSTIVGLERGREHTIHAGALILERALFALRCESCTVSTRGWRHALLAAD